MIVRFAVICDLCRRRSEEYSSFPACGECGRDVCPRCTASSRVVGETMIATCAECAPRQAA